VKVILNSVYLGNIAYYSALKNADEALIEVCDHYEKQSYRNRTEIYGANGLLKLIIPLERRGKRMPLHTVKIDNEQRWRFEHWRSLESAYRSSPYFEYYEDHFAPFYSKNYTYLGEFNQLLQEKVIQLLKIETKISYTTEYHKEYGSDYLDLRNKIHPRIKPEPQMPTENYYQVFDAKCGFIPNLSILDLMFNEGPRGIAFL
jgi:hypothetical protein